MIPTGLGPIGPGPLTMGQGKEPDLRDLRLQGRGSGTAVVHHPLCDQTNLTTLQGQTVPEWKAVYQPGDGPSTSLDVYPLQQSQAELGRQMNQLPAELLGHEWGSGTPVSFRKAKIVNIKRVGVSVEITLKYSSVSIDGE
jgi:hypothetical protein